MARGGKRPGAGRKPGLRIEPRAKSPIRMAELRLAENLPELIETALSLALKDRDKQMVVYCIDRVLGRTVQPIDVTHQVHEIAAEYGVEPERVTSIVERLKAKQAG
jgi:hypothetical protein